MPKKTPRGNNASMPIARDATRVSRSAPSQPTMSAAPSPASRSNLPPQRVGRAARVLEGARNISGAVDAVASAAEAGISARRGDIAGVVGAVAGTAMAVLSAPPGASAIKRRALNSTPISRRNPVRRLGSLASDSPGAEESAQRMVRRATTPNNPMKDFDETIERRTVMRDNYRDAHSARLEASKKVTETFNRTPRGLLDPAPTYSGRIRQNFDANLNEVYVSVPFVGGVARKMGAQSSRVRLLEATAKENETIARVSRKRKK